MGYNNYMKKIIILIVTMITTTGLLAACGFFLNPGSASIKDDVYMEYETMMDAFVEIESITEVSNYITFWAQTLGMETQKDRSESVIVETSGISTNGDNTFITIECGISLDNLSEDLRAAAIAMVLLKEIDEALPLRVLFVPYEGQNYYGAIKLPSYYLKNTKMIQLNSKYPNDVLTQGASSKWAYIERPIKLKKPTYKMAYQITIDGFSNEFPIAEFSNAPNGVKELGILFATFKSKGILFEIADFNGGGPAEFESTTASAIMVINQNDIKSLQYYYEKIEERLKNNYGSIHPDLLVTMSAVELPASVLSEEDTNNIISFIYTIFNGFCGTSENAFSSLNQLDITNSNFSCSLHIRNLIPLEEVEENDDLNVICNLNNMNYELKEMHNGWYQNPDSKYVNDFLEISNKKPKTTFSKSSLVEYQARDREMEKFSYGVDLKDCDRQFFVLKNYINSIYLAPQI